MKNINEKLIFNVACTTFFLASCEETYNDKLFCRENSARNMARISNHPSGPDLQRRKALIGKTRQLSDGKTVKKEH